MLSNLPEWLSQSPRTRRKVMTLWRALLRVERARLAFGILVLCGKDDRVLLLPGTSGAPKLPVKELDGWVPIPKQIVAWLAELWPGASKPALVSIDGSAGREGVFFIYTARLQGDTPTGSELWLEPHAAACALENMERRVVLRCANIPLSGI